MTLKKEILKTDELSNSLMSRKHNVCHRHILNKNLFIKVCVKNNLHAFLVYASNNTQTTLARKYIDTVDLRMGWWLSSLGTWNLWLLEGCIWRGGSNVSVCLSCRCRTSFPITWGIRFLSGTFQSLRQRGIDRARFSWDFDSNRSLALGSLWKSKFLHD